MSGVNWNDYKEEIKELFNQNCGSGKILKALIGKHGDIFPVSAERRIRKKLQEWGFREDSVIDETLHRGNLDKNSWKAAWLKGDEASILVRNPDFEDGPERVTEEDIRAVVEEIVGGRKPMGRKKYSFGLFAFRGITTDEHVGLDPNPKGDSLFQYEYNADIYKGNMEKYFNSVVKLMDIYGRAECIFIDSLGDTVDGWNGQTTRGGHHLPQNMSNQTAFEVAVTTKVNMLEGIIEANPAERIIVRQITKDNHGGDFTWIVGRTVQMIMERLYKKEVIEFINIARFIEHFYYGDHCNLLTHGKDDVDMKRGLPLRLDDKTVRYIRSYLDYYNVVAKYIHLDKGDLHQVGYDRTKKFDYRNFMSMAPPSKWAQHNFGDSYFGYSTQVIPKHNNEIIHTDYLIEFNKITK